MSEVGRRIAAARAYAGIKSQSTLAEAVGTSQSTLQRIESGDRSLKPFEQLGLLRLIAEECGLPYEWFTADFTRLHEIAPSTVAEIVREADPPADESEHEAQ